MFTDRTVTILTAATGSANLPRCAQSVQRQTYAQTEHLILIDGPECDEQVRRALATIARTKPIHLLTLPEITSRDGWDGHRIYAAGSFLCNTEFICFLDENHCLEPDHAQSLITTLAAEKAPWACAAANDQAADANGLMLKRELAVMTAPSWYVPLPAQPGTAIHDLLRARFPKPAGGGAK